MAFFAFIALLCALVAADEKVMRRHQVVDAEGGMAAEKGESLLETEDFEEGEFTISAWVDTGCDDDHEVQRHSQEDKETHPINEIQHEKHISKASTLHHLGQ